MNQGTKSRLLMRPEPRHDVANIKIAIANLKRARDQLHYAGAHRAGKYVARALKSAEGALRHASRGDVLARDDDDDGCPKGDPGCLSRNGECHDTCEAPREGRAHDHSYVLIVLEDNTVADVIGPFESEADAVTYACEGGFDVRPDHVYWQVEKLTPAGEIGGRS